MFLQLCSTGEARFSESVQAFLHVLLVYVVVTNVIFFSKVSEIAESNRRDLIILSPSAEYEQNIV